jgi:hypothetical protein
MFRPFAGLENNFLFGTFSICNALARGQIQLGDLLSIERLGNMLVTFNKDGVSNPNHLHFRRRLKLGELHHSSKSFVQKLITFPRQIC